MTSAARLSACPDCDLLQRLPPPQAAQRAHCPRCAAVLAEPPPRFPQLSLAAALCGLMLFIPATCLPILRFTLAGQTGSNTLAEGILRLWQQGFELLALLVLLCSLLAPLLHLLLNTFIGLCQALQRCPSSFAHCIKLSHFMQDWSMLEVYAIGILVAYVKMMDDGDIEILSGSYCLAGLMVSLILCAQSFNSERAWQFWEQPR
ncbi:paraquat-inducible protein A [Spongiibacter sp.]|uniref:paraquat-inducible protein A n=1 Tax=Spongiibacter sp. TaxID=2024860 RepID=UPI00356AD02D